MSREQWEILTREWGLITLALMAASWAWLGWFAAILIYVVFIAVPDYLDWRETSKPEREE